MRSITLLKVDEKVAIKSGHEKKGQKFWTAQQRKNNVSKPVLLKSIVHNFSSYNLTQEEQEAWSYGLDHHILTNININNIKTEFESFFQNLLYDHSDITENEISKVKTKLRNTCEKYCHVKVPYKQKKIISNLSNRKDLITLKQDKGRGVVITDRSNYTEKCRMTQENHWDQKYNEQFEKFETVWTTVQEILFNRKFYGTAKIHEPPVNGGNNELPIRPIPANIGLDEDVLKTSFVFVFRRRLGQDQYIRLGHMSPRRLQDVFKMSLKRL